MILYNRKYDEYFYRTDLFSHFNKSYKCPSQDSITLRSVAWYILLKLTASFPLPMMPCWMRSWPAQSSSAPHSEHSSSNIT